jgi:predicted dehydrogenase
MFNSLVWSVEQPIETVFAFADNVGTPVDINGTVNIRFANGVLATMVIGGNCPSNGSAMTFIFDNGRIECDGWGGSWIKVWKGGDSEIQPELQGQSSTPNDNFIDAILGRAEPRTSPINGVIQSQLMDAIYESAESGNAAHPKNE